MTNTKSTTLYEQTRTTALPIRSLVTTIQIFESYIRFLFVNNTQRIYTLTQCNSICSVHNCGGWGSQSHPHRGRLRGGPRDIAKFDSIPNKADLLCFPQFLALE